jgi:3-hydroxybutyryl-CoA dehydrogenase
MQIVVLADDHQKSELLLKNKSENVIVEFVDSYPLLLSYKNAEALFILQNEPNIDELKSFTLKPVFIHSVVSTLKDLDLSANISRINAWPTFLKRDLWEVATKDEAIVKNIFEAIGWKYLVTPDEPGFIAARIIAMVINEAYFAFEDGVSSKDEIDVAMQAGTNYPYGPFEWAQKIGLSNIFNLLKRLNKSSRRYDISSSLEMELANIE